MFDNVLTYFTGPNENPLSEGGDWTQSFGSRDPLRRLSNNATDSVHGNPNYSHWTHAFTTDSGPLDVWACSEGGQLGAALESWRVALWSPDFSERNGYEVLMGGAIGKTFGIRTYINNVINPSPTQGCVGTFTYYERIGIRINGNDVEAWGYIGGTWTLQCSITDTTFRGTMYGGLGIEDPTGGGLTFSCFGAGGKNRTQIYRIIRGFDQ